MCSQRVRTVILAIIDTFLSLFVFFPLAILHWRGTWDLQDIYFIPNNIWQSSWFSLLVGTVGSLAIHIWQPFFYATVTPQDGCLYLIASRLHLYICGWVTMAYWRGVWNLLDLYLTEAWLNSVIILVVAQLVTLVTRTSRNNVGLPVSFPILDTDDELLAPDTALGIKPSQPLRYAGDFLFTQLVVVTANIGIWRGIWNICDEFLFPHRHLTSDLVSITVGYVILIVLFVLEAPCSYVSAVLSRRSSSVAKVLWEDAIMIVATWGTLLLWRGGWDLCLKYVIPDKVIGGWVSHILGTFGLIVLQVFNNVALNGMERDGGYPEGEGIFPTDYLRILLSNDHQKKSQKPDVQLVEVSSPLLENMEDGQSHAEEDEDDDSGVSLEKEPLTRNKPA